MGANLARFGWILVVFWVSQMIRFLVLFWACLGPSLGASLVPVLGRLGPVLGCFGPVLGLSWAVLGLSWAVLSLS